MSPAHRDIQVKIMLSPDERAMVRALAEREGVTVSAWIRAVIRRLHTAAMSSQQARRDRKGEGP